MSKRFKDLTEQEILSLATGQEEEDSRIYGAFADALAQNYPASAAVFRGMQAEELHHHNALADLYRQQFGEKMPIIKRDDVRGFIKRRPVWLVLKMGLKAMREQAQVMELETTRFYRQAAARTKNESIRKLLTDLAQAEEGHASTAGALTEQHLTTEARGQEDAARRKLFLLQVVQPGLAGLMDGSVSTLAPLFAAAFATHNTYAAFAVGLAAAVGAGISMGFAEALSDDGALTGRGHPLIRGGVCGLMTAAGGLGHTLPYLIPNFKIATIIAACVVCVELFAISFIRRKFMDTPFLRATFQVVVGGVLVLLAGILIGKFLGTMDL
ncbi:MAG TPA: ferritin family protein [Phycisphaerae bacterium]|nr:ferritin family protein [Phycisphaerae bacterium]